MIKAAGVGVCAARFLRHILHFYHQDTLDDIPYIHRLKTDAYIIDQQEQRVRRDNVKRTLYPAAHFLCDRYPPIFHAAQMFCGQPCKRGKFLLRDMQAFPALLITVFLPICPVHFTSPLRLDWNFGKSNLAESLERQTRQGVLPVFGQVIFRFVPPC